MLSKSLKDFAGATLTGSAKLASKFYHNASPIKAFIRQRLVAGWEEGKSDKPQTKPVDTCCEEHGLDGFGTNK